MNRRSIKRFETILCVVGISFVSIWTMSHTNEYAFELSKSLEYRLYELVGIYTVTLPLVIWVCTAIAVQFFIGGIVFRKNDGGYGLACSILPISVALTPLIKDSKYGIAVFVLLFSSILATAIAKLSGTIFSGKSPIASLNWQTISLNIMDSTPTIWIVTFDILIFLNCIAFPVAIASFIFDSDTGVLGYLFVAITFAYLYSLVLLRNERILGFYLFLIINIGFSVFFLIYREALVVLYYVDKMFVLKAISTGVLTFIPLVLSGFFWRRLS